MGEFKNILIKKEDRRRRRKTLLTSSSLLIISFFAAIAPFAFIGAAIYGQTGGIFGVLLGLVILTTIEDHIIRNILVAVHVYGFKWQNIVTHKKYKIVLPVDFLLRIGDGNINLGDVLIEDWLREKVKHYQIYSQIVYFQKEEDLIHFKLVWF